MTLIQLQRRMAAAVMRPLTSGGRPAVVGPDGIAMRKEAAALIKPNARLTSLQRLEIYSRSYWFRLLDSFADDFPGLRAVLGQTGFNRLARAYIAACPSRSFTLRNLGANLEEWLRINQQYGGRSLGLALDMARLEWAHIEAFDTAGETPLGPEDLAHLNRGFRVGLQPHVRLLDVDYAVDEIRIQANRDIEDPGREGKHGPTRFGFRRLSPERIFLAVHRWKDTVYYRRLAPEEYLVLKEIRTGRQLEWAIRKGFRRSSTPAEDRAAIVRSWFAAWAEMRWLCRALTVKKKGVSRQ